MQNNTFKSIKFTYKDDIRRFTLTPEVNSLEQMIFVIRELSHLDESPLVVKYLDDEGEWITMDRDIEFETALSLDGDVLKLNVADADAGETLGKCERRGGRCRGGRGGRGMRGHFGHGPHHGHSDGEPHWREEGRSHFGGRGGFRGGRGGRGMRGHFGHGPHHGHFSHHGPEGKQHWEPRSEDENVTEGDLDTENDFSPIEGHFGHPGHGPHHFGHPGHGPHSGHFGHHGYFGHSHPGHGPHPGHHEYPFSAGDDDVEDTECGEIPDHHRRKWKGKCGKGWKKGKGRKCGKGWKHNRFDSDSESSSVDPSLSAKEIRAEIQKLVQSKSVVLNNLKQANQSLGEKKADIRDARQNPEITHEEIAELRSELAELKKSKFLERHSLFSTKKQIFKLRKALHAMKQETSDNTSEIEE